MAYRVLPSNADLCPSASVRAAAPERRTRLGRTTESVRYEIDIITTNAGHSVLSLREVTLPLLVVDAVGHVNLLDR